MGEVYTYNATHLTTVRDGSVSLTQSAELGQVGSGSFVIDDTAGTVSIVGQKDFSHTESSCSFTRTFKGYVGPRSYERAEVTPKVAAPRLINVELQDLNAMLGFRFFYPIVGLTAAQCGDRPAETVSQRMTWLLASPFVASYTTDAVTLFVDGGRVASSTNVMEATNYRNRYPGEVIGECALAAQGFNYYIRDFGSGPELVFRNDNTSTADTSTLRISNVLADASSVTIHPFKDFALRRDPSNVYSALGFNYAKGTTYLGRAATATAFNGWRSGVVSDSNVRTSAEALSRSVQLLFQRSTEEDMIEGTVLLTSAQVNLIMHGDRISAKFSHLGSTGGRNYDSFTWCRVLERTVKPIVADGGLYEVHLKLSPQEVDCEDSVLPTIEQYKTNQDLGYTLPEFTYTPYLDAPSTTGNLLVLAVMTPRGPSTNCRFLLPSGWSAAVWEELTDPDGVAGSFCSVIYKVSAGEQSVDLLFLDDFTNEWFTFAEIAGLSNPTLHAAASVLQQDSGLGYSSVPATSYPAGPTAVLAFTFMEDGPLGSDNLTANGTGMSLTYPLSGPDHDNIVIGMGQMLRDSTSGATALYPAAGGWRFLFTGNGDTLTVGLAFEGADCS